MDTLISLGATAAYLYSAWLLFWGNNYATTPGGMSTGPTGQELVGFIPGLLDIWPNLIKNPRWN